MRYSGVRREIAKIRKILNETCGLNYLSVKDANFMLNKICEALVVDEKSNGWIPVSERLPEEDGRYLVTFKYGIKVCMVGYGSCKRTVLGYPIGHGWYSLEEAQYYAEDSIIAWMPLPEPYKED